jgi:hypothetical protein
MVQQLSASSVAGIAGVICTCPPSAKPAQADASGQAKKASGKQRRRPALADGPVTEAAFGAAPERGAGKQAKKAKLASAEEVGGQSGMGPGAGQAKYVLAAELSPEGNHVADKGGASVPAQAADGVKARVTVKGPAGGAKAGKAAQPAAAAAAGQHAKGGAERQATKKGKQQAGPDSGKRPPGAGAASGLQAKRRKGK